MPSRSSRHISVNVLINWGRSTSELIKFICFGIVNWPPARSSNEGPPLRFFFVKTLRRPYLPDDIPFPKRQRRLPTVLSQDEAARLIDSASNLMQPCHPDDPLWDWHAAG